MATIHPVPASRPVPPDIIRNERACVGCGYCLKGLRLGGKCPECGLAIKGKKRAPRYTDQLVHAPMAWLDVLAIGALLMFLAAAAALLMILTLLFVRNVPMLVVLGGITIGWAAGVWLCTRPRPVMPTTTVNVLEEWRRLRVAARVTQLFWPLTVLLVLFSVWVYNSTISTTALYAAIALAGLSLTVAVGGLAPTCALLAHLADWAEDSSLAQSLRGCAWTVGFCGVVISLAVLNAYTGLLGRAMGGILAVFLIAMVFMPPAYFLVCLFRMQSMARWAVWNHVAAEAKLDRFRANAQAAGQKTGRAASSSQHVPPAQR